MDQTFTTVVQSFTHVDLKFDEMGKCGCDRNTTAEEEHCLYMLNGKVTIFFCALIITVLVLTIWALCKKMKSEAVECCSWENCGIFIYYISVCIFMGTYVLTDNRWLWTCAIPNKYATLRLITRLIFLILSLMFAISMCGVHIGIHCPSSCKRTRSLQEIGSERIDTEQVEADL